MSPLTSASALLQELLGALPGGAAALDLEGRVLALNPEAQRLLGLSEAGPLSPGTSLVERLRCTGEDRLAHWLEGALNQPTAEVSLTCYRPRAHAHCELRVRRQEQTVLVLLSEVTQAKWDEVGRRASEERLGERLEAERVVRRRAESSAAILDLALENLQAGVALIEATTGRLLHCNRRLESLLGRAASALDEDGLGGASFVSLDGTPLAPERTPLRHTLETGEDVRGEELGYWRADGVFVRLKVSTTAMHGQVGRGLVVLAVFEDVTRQRRAEDHLRFLADASSALARSLDADTLAGELARIAVPEFADWCTVHLRDEGGGLTLRAATHRVVERVPYLRELDALWLTTYRGEHGWPKVLRTGLPELFQSSEARPFDGPAAPREQGASPPHEGGAQAVLTVPLLADGQCLGTLTFGRLERASAYTQQDVLVAMEVAGRAATAIDLVRLYRLAQTEQRRAEEANQLKDEFLSTLSHELRTPLTSLLGWVQMLRSGALSPEKQRRALETIERNARTQIRLIGDLLDVSGVVTGKLKLRLSPTDFAGVLEEAVSCVRPAAQAKGLVLETSCPPGVWVMADATRLSQVMWNLLHNAVKFTPSGGSVRVEVEVGAQLEVIVQDSGEGITPEFLPHVFERFRQEEGSSTRRHGGLGLGLAVVKHLAELHGGTVEAASEGRGKGARFTLRLPLAAAALATGTLLRLPEQRATRRRRTVERSP